MLLSALAIALLGQQHFGQHDFYPYKPYDPSITRPESILGYKPGEKHTTFREQEQVIFEIARNAPKRVKVWEFGRSWESRPLKLIAVSSERNIASLESLRQKMARVAKGESISSAELEAMPAFVWVNQTIHGNESASFESGMWLLYNLAASRNREVTQALDNVVVLINPVYNPDGHERFVVWNRSLAVGSAHPEAFEGYEPEWVHGRTNHYRFDMNRDRVAFSQAETRAEVAEFNRWNPQVYIDQHGQTSEYFFPPNSMATNINVDRERLEKWTQIFGRSYAKAFDKKGWLYFIRNTFDFYFTGYLDTYATLSGAIGMTHETDGGRRLNDKKDDDSPLTVEGGMIKHFTTAMTTIFTSSEHKKDLLASFATFKRKAVTGEHAGKFKRVIVMSQDPRPLRRFHEHLKRAGIESYFNSEEFSQPSSHDYWSDTVGEKRIPAGSLIIDMAQPQGPLAKATLEPGQDFEPEFIERQMKIADRLEKKDRYPNPEFPEFYDVTGWSLVYCYNLPAVWAESAPAVSRRGASPSRQPSVSDLADSDVGYAIPYTDQEDILAAVRILGAGIKGRVMSKPMKLGSQTFSRGTFFFLKGRNENLRNRLAGAIRGMDVEVRTIPSAFAELGSASPGGEGYQMLKEPKIGVVFGDDASTTDYGAIWYLLERELGLEFTPLHKNALQGDLGEFTCILFPPGSYTIGERLRSWIQSGGCAVVLGSPGWAIGDGRLVRLDSNVPEGSTAKSVPGAFFKAVLDGRSFLSYGYTSEESAKVPCAIQVDGSRFFKPGTGGFAAVAFGEEDKKLLSGWAWPNDSEKHLKGAAAVWEQPLGQGHVVAFMWNPAERAMFPGQMKLMLNAIVLGPG